MKNPNPRPKTVTPTRSIRIPLARTSSRTGSQVASSPRAAIQIFVSRMEAFLGTELFGSDKPITIGRHGDADMRLVGDTVSRRHCLLTLEGRRLYLQDLGSANGTLVNRKRIKGRVEVRPNDTIQVGAFTLKVRPLIPVPARGRQESGISDATTRIEAVLSAEGSKGTEESPLDLGSIDLGERKDWRLYEQALRRQTGGEAARSVVAQAPAPRTPSRAHVGPEETPVTEEMEERSPTSRGTHARRPEERLEPTRRAVELDTRAQARIEELDKLMKRIDSEAHPASRLEVEEDSGESIWCEVPESFAAKVAGPIEEIPSCSEIVELAPDLSAMSDATFTDFLARELGRAAGLDEGAAAAPADVRARSTASNPFAIVPNQDIPDNEDSAPGGTQLSASDVAALRAASRAALVAQPVAPDAEETPIAPVPAAAARMPSVEALPSADAEETPIAPVPAAVARMPSVEALPSAPIGDSTEITDGPSETAADAAPIAAQLEDDSTEPSLVDAPSMAADARSRLVREADEILSREAAELLALAAAQAMQQPSPRAAVAQAPAGTPRPAAPAAPASRAIPTPALAAEEPSTLRPAGAPRTRSVNPAEIPAAAAARTAATRASAEASPASDRAAAARLAAATASASAEAANAHAEPRAAHDGPRGVGVERARSTLSPAAAAPAQHAHELRAAAARPSDARAQAPGEPRASRPSIEAPAAEEGRLVARRGTLAPVAPSQPALRPAVDPASIPSIRARSIAASRTGSIAAPPPAAVKQDLAAPISQQMSGEYAPEEPQPVRPQPAPQSNLRGGSQAAMRAALAQEPATPRASTGARAELPMPPPSASTEQVRPRSIPRAAETQKASLAQPKPAAQAPARPAAPPPAPARAYSRPSAPAPGGMQPEAKRPAGAVPTPAAAMPVPTSVATAPKTGVRPRPVEARLVTPTPLRINVSPIAAEARDEQRRATVERVHSGAPGTGVASAPKPAAPIPSEEVTGESTEELTADEETFSAVEIAARAGDRLLDIATLRHTGEQYILGHRTPQGTVAPHGEHSGLRLLRITENREVDLVFPREVGGHLMRDNETVMFHELGRGRKYSCLRLKPRDVATVILGEGPGRVSYHVRVIRAPRFQR